MSHDNDYFIDNDIQPTGTYHGFKYALIDSPCDTKNGYVHVPNDVCETLFTKFNVPSHAHEYHSDVITGGAEDYERFEDLLRQIGKRYRNNIKLLHLERKAWLTYGDSQGWIGFDVCHLGDGWLDDDGTLRAALPVMRPNDNGTGWIPIDNTIDVMQPLDDEALHDITAVWDEQEVIRECEKIIDTLRFGLAYNN